MLLNIRLKVDVYIRHKNQPYLFSIILFCIIVWQSEHAYTLKPFW
jgi:hypothetical protein